MSVDATFEDGAERPLNLTAADAEDLQVISTLAQDAILPVTEMKYQSAARRFALLINRFRWEDKTAAERLGRAYERVQAVLAIDDVQAVRTQGFDRSDSDLVLSVLSIAFEPGDDGEGQVVLTLAGDGAIALDVECLNITLRDVTRPYIAPSRKAPEHD
ncbi:hypothetical protein ATO10_09603 [Actibacterium atlanticum]|uniref:DUF2948 family protein n=1 Tax=Actibacterium atlanticum TaxID=1461693 RepID=A0A058ZLL8_9RHOB|nr:DUF2948 family protein [Actibacterium atlanticum]KCV82092.1 hypothetical protein ATO10_09603 [Actibacterium atlanticum]